MNDDEQAQDQDQAQQPDPQADNKNQRPAWLWKVIWIIMALVLLQAAIVAWFWLRL